MNDFIKITKSLEDSGLLIDGIQLVKPVIYSVVKGISGRGVRKAGRGYICKILLHPLNNMEIY